MSDENLPTAIWSGELKIGKLVLKVHVLDNGQRVIEEESVAAFMRWLESEANLDEVKRFGVAFAEWARATGIPKGEN